MQEKQSKTRCSCRTLMLLIRLLLIASGAFVLIEAYAESVLLDGSIIEKQFYIVIFSYGGLLLLIGLLLPWICSACKRFLPVRILAFLLAAAMVFLIVVGGIIAIYPFTVKRADGTEPYVLVLGAPVIQDEPTILLKSRADKATQWLAEHPDTAAILSGGNGSPRTEAEVLRDLICAAGISSERLIIESEAASTRENFANTARMLQSASASDTFSGGELAVLTSRFHMFRSHCYAETEGFEDMCFVIAPTPSETGLLWFCREVVMTVRYWFTGL